MPLEAVSIGNPPPDNATAIAVLDSGILSNHPLLRNAVGDEISVGTRYSDKIDDNKPADDVGHGTKVSGIAVYGDIKQCIESGIFQPEVWILSAKVMYAEQNPVTGRIEAKYDEEELLEHQLETAIRECKQRQNCKVVNLSLGNDYKKMFGHKKQFNLAALVDELAKESKLVFVVSTGNFREYRDKGFPDSYPNYLLENEEDVKIIDPATSALSITVGSVTQPYGPLNRHYQEGDLFFSPADTQYPSPFTRVGPGYQGMIKPEVVEDGGNIIEGGHRERPNEGGMLITLNPNWLSEGRLFSIDHGTSFSTPKIANCVARLFNKYPYASPNLIKALLFSSAQVPENRPTSLSKLDFQSSDEKLIELLQVYGYGKPNFDRSAFSSSNRALLINEGRLKPNSIDVYYVYLPDEFVEIKGKKRLSVTLVYDPPVNKNRIDYMGCSMEFHLFRNVEVDEVVRNYRPIAGELAENTLTEEDMVPQTFKNSEIKLHPGVTLRKKGVHQKGIVEYSGKPGLDTDKPLVLVVICQNRWIKEDIGYLQDYAVVVATEHSMNIDLLNKVRARNQVRVRATLGKT
jgi:hypothetical protein